MQPDQESSDNDDQQVMVVGPDGRPVGMARVPKSGEDDEEQGVGTMVEQPAKVMRIGTMIKQLLEEVRAAPLDEASRARLKEIHENSIKELEDGLAPELREELHRLSLPFTDNTTPSDAELRIAQAQLVGWLEGLFHGIQTALFAQQMAARAQLEQMRRGLPPGALTGPAGPRGRPGPGHRAVPVVRDAAVRINRLLHRPPAWSVARRYARVVAQTVTTGDDRAEDATSPPAPARRRPGPAQLAARVRRPRAGLAAAPAVGLPGLAGHQAALPTLGARAAVDQHQHGRHRHRDGHPVRRAVRRGHRHLPALRGHRAADLELRRPAASSRAARSSSPTRG